MGYPQASFHVGARLAADIVIALNERELSGLGQHLDASMQEAMTLTLMNGTGYPHYTGGDPPGYGDDRAQPRRAAWRRMLGAASAPTATWSSRRRATPSVLSRHCRRRAAGAARERAWRRPTLEGIDWDAWGDSASQGDEASAGEIAAAFEAVRESFSVCARS